MDAWEQQVSIELNAASGTDQVAKGAPDMKDISVKQHMDKAKSKKLLKQGAWEWILRRLGELTANVNAPGK
jgi:hypothetical protein